jgi:hypothetical protein
MGYLLIQVHRRDREPSRQSADLASYYLTATGIVLMAYFCGGCGGEGQLKGNWLWSIHQSFKKKEVHKQSC